MALSLISSHSNYNELQTYFDPLRNFDFTFQDQMEYSNNLVNNIQSPSNQRHFSQATQNDVNGNTFDDYEQVINFVDSPPNSKESWSAEYSKGNHQGQPQQQQPQGPTIVDVQTIYSNNSNRKRRMDWDSLDVPQNDGHPQSTVAKITNLGNKEREKKKSSGRGSWSDDISDFDLNGEFSNNGYLNNAESFLSFSPALTALKQEIPSPNSDVQKGNKSPHQSKIESLEKDLLCNSTENIHEKVNPNNRSPINNQPSQQNVDSTAQGSRSPIQNISKPNGIIVNFPHIIQAENSSDDNNVRNSPQRSPAESTKEDHKFQYILAAATSIATKSNEETLTYLNQGQSYEIKLKKIGDLSFYRDKLLKNGEDPMKNRKGNSLESSFQGKSIIKICFHERRLQYMEREQMQQWQASRPGERILEVDVPLSYGLCHVAQPSNPQLLNTVEIVWDPMKEVGVYIKVNCISTEFTPKKHGGEKGVPFRIQIETYLENNNNNNNNNTNNNNSIIQTTQSTNNNNNNNNNNANSDNNINLGKLVHAAACQIKVFKLKGADRKHKQDKEKIQKRPLSEQEKFQPSYECTILNELSLESITPTTGCYSPEYMKYWPNSPVHMSKCDGVIPFPTSNSVATSPVAINSVTSTQANPLKLLDQGIVSPQRIEMDEYAAQITKDSSPSQVSQWLSYNRLNAYLGTFSHYSGSDILRMSKEDLVQICALADGIRMFNTLHAKAITPRLTIYLSFDGNNYHAIYLNANTVKELTQKIFKLPGFYDLVGNGSSGVENAYNGWGMLSKYSGSGSNIFNDASKLQIYTTGPSGIHVMVTDEVLANAMKDESLYSLEIINGKVLMKIVNKNE